MKVKGRDKPTVLVTMADDGGVCFEIGLELRPDAWVNIYLTRAELLALANSEPLEKP